MDINKLKDICDKHLKWLRCEDGGSRADLYGADLYGSDLCNADLYGANLRGADLRGADLCNADLRGADLRGADLRGADLRGANLRGADLRGADLYGANLRGADLYGSDLCNADLYGANLCNADLRGADLRGADLRGADLRGACGIDIALLNKFLPICCPEYGSFIGWKKASGNHIVRLRITENAKRSSAYGRKCRCSEAEVLAIENIAGSNSEVECVYSQHDKSFEYRVGQTVRVDNFDDDRRNECAPGIHFFITRQEAVDY